MSLKNFISMNYRKITKHLKKNNENYKPGISAMIRVKDEEEWIYDSLVSASYLADELVIASFSNKENDESNKQIRKFVSEYKEKIDIKFFEMNFLGSKKHIPFFEKLETMNYCLQSNLALKNCSKSVIIRWDGDFVAEKEDMVQLRDILLEIDKTTPYYWFAYLPVINLFGDVFHVNKLFPVNFEPRIHSNSSSLHFYYNIKSNRKSKTGFEFLKLPFFYERKNDLAMKRIFHASNLKPYENLLRRAYWIEWRRWVSSKKYSLDLDNFISNEIKLDKHDCVFQKEFFSNHFTESLLIYKNEYGPIPKALKKSKYKILYKDGYPVTRNDFHS